MTHLTLEALARLVDEPPTAQEATHLERCSRCGRELAALREQTGALGALAPPPVPAGIWEAARRRAPATRPARARWSAGAMRAAAAVVIFLVGTAFGMRVDPGDPVVADAGEEAGSTARSELPAEGYASAEFGHPGDALTRIAALEVIVATTRAALAEAPGDPVINGYHLSARELRDQTLRAIGAVEIEEDDGWF